VIPADTAKPSIYAIDFGTSNSLLAAANAERVFPPAPLDVLAEDSSILRSILYFPTSKECFVGQEALVKYIENGLEGRLLRSLKRHLPARGFRGTNIDNRPVSVEDLVAVPLREMRTRANAHYGADVRRAVLGRPARFSSDDADDDFAEARLRTAAERAGFEEVHFLPEPVAAAQEFQAAFALTRATLGSQVQAEAQASDGGYTALVCDFGGGTSDFTVLRLGQTAFNRNDVLAVGGVPLAGDAFDASIMRARVAKHFGAEVSYRVPMGSNVLTMPKHIIETLCSPAHLSILRRPDIADFLRNVRSWSLGGDDRERLDQLTTLVDDALGFQLFESIETAKKCLSKEDQAAIEFSYADIELRDHVTRAQFDVASDSAAVAILRSLDETLASSGLNPKQVDLVCCTGGTAKVPRLRTAIAERFGSDRIRDFNSFHSVVLGLARHAKGIAAQA
jgi:hypothetical chaperone protein